MPTTTNVSPYDIKQGSFAVDANGQATYNLPIKMPPGINGFQPDLGVSYGHQGLNGLMGVGWNLTGLSAISLTKAIVATDGYNGAINYDANDRYALDGQRLLNIQGDYFAPDTVYFTEVHDWKQIVAGGDPSEGFTVYAKTGEIWKYGTTADSLISANGNANNIRLWALASVEDLHGNLVEYSYISDEGAYYIDTITYNKTTITFSYTDRTDQMVTYLGGYEIQTNKLLANIGISIATESEGNATVCNYNFNYTNSVTTGLSLLNEVIITGADGSALPPISIAWQGEASPSFTTMTPTSLLNSGNVVNTMPMDVNGDGITDIVQITQSSGQYAATVFLGGANSQYTLQGNTTLGNYPSGFQMLTGDVTGDGRSDLIIVYPSYSCGAYFLSIDVFPSNGTGFGSVITTNTTFNWIKGNSFFYVIDANGDGCADIVQAYGVSAQGPSFLNFSTFLSTAPSGSIGFATNGIQTSTQSTMPATQATLISADVNGDGMVDMVLLQKNGNSLSTTSFVTTSTPSGLNVFGADPSTGQSTGITTVLPIVYNSATTYYPADANGDGIVDLVAVYFSQGSQVTIQSVLSNAVGGFVAGPVKTFQGSTGGSFFPMGLLGGSQTCLVNNWLDNSEWNFYLYCPSPNGTFTESENYPTTIGFTNLNFSVGDTNGDGKADLMYFYKDLQNGTWVQPFVSSGLYPDLVSTITDQLGGVTSIEYLPLSDPSVYSESGQTYPATTARRYPNHLSPAQFPMQDVIGRAFYVVSGYTLQNNSSINRFGYTHSYQMTYTDACVDLQGRGWQGFGSVTALDLGTGQEVAHYYLQSFPFTGCLSASTISGYGLESGYDPRIPAGTTVLLSESVNTYGQVSICQQNNAAQTAYSIQQTGMLNYDYDYGTFNYVTARTYAYDEYNNRANDTWYGYVAYIDPESVDPTAPFPAVTAQSPDLMVYTYSYFQNCFNGYGVQSFLGYLNAEKQSQNSTDQNSQGFVNGDYNYITRSYTTDGCYDLQQETAYDNANSVTLTTSYTYDQYGNRLTETKPGDFTTTYVYESYYNTYISQVSLPVYGLMTYHSYDPRFGSKVGFTDENGNIFITGFDAFGRKNAEQGPLPAGTSVSDPNCITEYATGTTDFSAATVLTINAISYNNDNAGGIYLETDTLQSFPTDATRDILCGQMYTDGLGRECESVVLTGQTAGSPTVLTTYDYCGKPSTKTFPFFATDIQAPVVPQGVTVNYTYDVLGRNLTIVSPGGADGLQPITTACAYAAGTAVTGDQTTITDAAGTGNDYVQVTTSQSFNGKSQKVLSVIPGDNNATTTFVFDGIGRMTGTTDPDGISNVIVYDSMNRKTSMDNPDQNPAGYGTNTKAMSYYYYADTGLLYFTIDASGITTQYTYDQMGRVLTQNYSDDRTITYTYDTPQNNGLGLLTGVEIKNSVSGMLYTESIRTITYDNYSNVAGDSLNYANLSMSFNTTSAYDPQRRLVSQTMPDNTTMTRTYQSGLLVAQALDGASMAYPLDSYYASGATGAAQFGNNALAATYARNALGMLYGETLDQGSGGTPLLNYTLTYDPLNQLLTNTESLSGRMESFGYLNKRLVTAAVPGFAAGNGAYQYDSAGNFKTKDGNTYTYDSNNHFPTAIGGNYSATQDACGRTQTVTLNAQGPTPAYLTYLYDGMGCLTSIVQDSVNQLRGYMSDDSGNRILETQPDGTQVFYVNSAYRYQVDAMQNTTVTKFLKDQQGAAASIVTYNAAPATIVYYRSDIKGNLTHSFDVNGVLQCMTAYDGFGLPLVLSGTNNFDLNYESKYWDSLTGLHYFGARYYNPVTGTFLTPDTQLGGQSITQQDAWNRFAFELNNPVNNIDPSGHTAGQVVAGIAIGVGLILLGIGIGWLLAPFLVGAGMLAVAAASALTGAVVGAGVSAGAYSVITAIKGEDFSWGDFAWSMASGALSGAITGGILGPVGGLIGNLTAKIVSEGGKTAARVIANMVVGAGVNSAMDVASTALTNAVYGRALDSGLATSAVVGAIAGGIFGGLAGKFGYAEGAANKAGTAAAKDLDDVATHLLNLPIDSPLRNYGALESARNFFVKGGNSLYQAAFNSRLRWQGLALNTAGASISGVDLGVEDDLE